MIKHEGNKYILYSKDGSKKLGTFDSEKEAKEREAEIQRIKHYNPAKSDAKGALVDVTLTITKASLQDDGTMRWQAVASDIDPDQTGERTSLPLFQDWIDRAYTKKSVPYLPPPRMPFLGLSHYPSLDSQLGEAGPSDKLYTDGDVFKANGTFYPDDNHPLGKLLFASVRKEQALIKKGEVIKKPIRISAAWWDISHAHGDFIFERKSLTDKCPMCESGATDKVYLKGQLDHFAATRVPINPRTSLELEQKAMTTRKEDALSIIDDPELVEEIDRQAKLTGKSETEELPDAMVVRADEEKAKAKKPDKEEMAEDEESEMAEGEEEEEDVPFGKKKKAKGTDDKAEKADVEQMGEMMEEEEHHMPFGGAMSLSDAEAFMSAQRQAGEVYSNWAMFDTVMRNILDYSEAGEMKGRVQSALSEFGDRIAAIKAAIEDVSMIEPVATNHSPAQTDKGVNQMTTITQAPVAQTADHPFEAAKAQYDQIMSNAKLSRAEKLQALQEQFNTLGETVKAQVDAVAPPDPSETIQKAMTPILEQLALIAQKLDGKVSQPVQAPAQPQQKSFAPMPNTVNLQPQGQGQQMPISPVTGQPSKLTAQIRKSVGIQAQ